MNAKNKLKNILINTIIFFIILNISQANAFTNELKINNKEDAEYAIKSLINSFIEEGVNKDNLAQSIITYREISSEYTNEDIINILKNNKKMLEESNISTENIDNVCKILQNFDRDKLNEILEKANIDEVLKQIHGGATVLEIIERTTANMTTSEKVDLMFSVLWSANILRTILILIIILVIYKILVRSIIYKKAGEHAWAILIPIYRDIVMLRICGMSHWWLLLLFVPIVGWIILWLVSVASRFMLAEAFNKNEVYGLGLWLLWPVFESILAFSKNSKYVGIEK